MKKKYYFLLTALLIALSQRVAAADVPFSQQPPVTLPNPLGPGVDNIPLLANRIIIGILGIVGAIALLAFIWGGLLWMTSAGNSERVEKGKQTLIYATLGLLVIFISYTVINFVFNALLP